MDIALKDNPVAKKELVEGTECSSGAQDSRAVLERRFSDFASLSEALDYAAKGTDGYNFYSPKGEIDIVLSYKDMRAQAMALGAKLKGLGLQRGDRVGIVADMDPDFVVAFYACQYAGLLAVPLPVITGLGGRHGYQEQLRQILDISEAKIAMGPEALINYLKESSQGLKVKYVATRAQLEDMDVPDGILEPFRSGEASHIQFSSGSTRYPCGILINQDALMANARSVGQDALSFQGDERVASWLPFYHDMGLIGCMIMPLTFQFTVDYIHTDAFARRPLQWLKIISDNQCTIAFSPSFGYEICARRAAGKTDLDLDLSSWRIAGIGGEMVQPDVLKKFAEAFAPYGFSEKAFVPSYGLAEATLAFSFVPLNTGVQVDYIDKNALVDEGIAKPVSQDEELSEEINSTIDVRGFAASGYAMPGYNVEIRGDHGGVLNERHVGRVFIKGPSLMAGYYRNREATNRVFDMNGWMDTGDMGYVSDNMLYITGRQKDLIIINGRNIWPQDLEWHAEQNVEELRPRDTAAFTMESDHGKERAVILVQCRLRDEEERKALRKKVYAAIMRGTGVDCQVILIPQRSLPYTTSGKLSRAKAKKCYLQGMYDRVAA